MIEHHRGDPAARTELTEQDLAIATLVGRYIERCEARQPPCAHDLLAVAAEFGDTAVDALRTVLACYQSEPEHQEALQASGLMAAVTGMRSRVFENAELSLR